MKISKKFSLILILSFLFIITQISCNSKEQPIEPSTETQSELESSNNIYFKYPVRDYPIGKTDNDELYWDCSENNFGTYQSGIYDGFHSGEDWNLKGGDDGSIDEGLPVYSIGIGKVVKVSSLGKNGNLGYLVAIEHSGNFVIPSKELSSNGQNASYGEEKVNKIYSVYMHLKDIEVNENDEVDKNSIIGYIMDPGGGPHLHFEIRHPESIPSSDWSMVYGSSGEYDKSNWQRFPDGGYNGYYKNLQKMIDAGFRDPSDFIEANYKSGEEYEEQEEVVEEVPGELGEEAKIQVITNSVTDSDGYVDYYMSGCDLEGNLVWGKKWENLLISELLPYSDYSLTDRCAYIEVAGTLYALDLFTGEELWTVDQIGAISVPFIDEQGRIYCAGYYGPFLTVINPDGSIKYRNNSIFYEGYQYDWPLNIFVKEGQVYVPCSILEMPDLDDVCLVFDQETGNIITVKDYKITHIEWDNVSASSTLQPDIDMYQPENIVDVSQYIYFTGEGEERREKIYFSANTDTAWVEGVPGPGIGEWIRLESNSPQEIRKIEFYNGYWKNDLYFKNNRLKTLRIDFSDGSYIIRELEDCEFHTFYLGKLIRTSYIQFTILDVYPGTHYDDTCVSGILIY